MRKIFIFFVHICKIIIKYRRIKIYRYVSILCQPQQKLLFISLTAKYYLNMVYNINFIILKYNIIFFSLQTEVNVTRDDIIIYEQGNFTAVFVVVIRLFGTFFNWFCVFLSFMNDLKE